MALTAILLDTSAYSALLRGNQEVKARIQRAERVVVTPIILGELRAGFLAGSKHRKNESELRRLLGSPRVEVVAVDQGTSERYAVILNALRRAGSPIPTNDIWISASAMQHGLPVLTTDAHYLRVEQVIVDCVGADSQSPGAP